jgi:two-component system CheB/CheR fusion protein
MPLYKTMHSEIDSTPSEIPEQHAFHIVGVGASAGGLEALEAFFHAMPSDTGMAFIVLQHLSPDFESHMDELLARQTAIPIYRVENGMRVQPNSIYLAPAKQEMIISGGKLLLTDRDPAQGFNLPIDHFLRALAHDAGRFAIGVVLSGTGSDGSRGIRDIHAAGGLVLCQNEESAKFDGMPRNARETGVVDLVLEPAAMAQALLSYAKRAPGDDDAGKQEPVLQDRNGIHQILRLLRTEYGIDFAHYKPNTVTRRVERRIAMASSVDIDDYAEHLRSNPEELSALYQDLLIGVTRFFRDRDAFAVLEERVIPALLDSTPPGEEIRVWVPGCATGEEAYSLAILLHEQLTARQRPIVLKMFGTDVHSTSLEIAAAGRYPEQALSEVSPARRERYFRPDGEENGEPHFRIAKELRQLIVFARHNVIRDAPFTRLHLVSCRNMLIYLQPLAQKKVLSLFHFGLRTDGILLLGPSETPGQFADEFETLDKRWKLYRKRRDIRLPLEARLPISTSAPVPRPAVPAGFADGSRRAGDRRLIALYDSILAKHMPPSLLVDEAHQLVHCFGGVEGVLRMPSGRATTNVLDLLPPALKTPVSGALQHAAKEHQAIRYTGLHANLGAGEENIRLVVEPFYDARSKTTDFLISIDRQAAPAPEPHDTRVDMGQVSQDYIGSLESELKVTRENLQATIEELETSNEELQATNEELVASNEELQSTNEELHSVNEELYTVNAEHQKHISELTEANTDIDNLLHSIDVGVVFLDAELRVRKFTAAIASAFHLLPQDVGRKFDHFAPNIEHPQLMDDIQSVLRDGVLLEREVVNRRGDFFFLRILPYRSGGAITGVVLTLIDIGTLKRTEASVRQLSAVVASSADAIIATDLSGTITAWNRGAEDLYGYTTEEAIGRNSAMLLPADRRDEGRELLSKVVRGQWLDDLETVRVRKDGHAIEVSMSASPIHDAHDKIVGFSSIARDITRRKRAERQVKRAIEQRDHFLAMLSHELRNPLMGLLTAAHILEDDSAPAEAKQRAVGVVNRQSLQMARLLDDLLDVSRMRRDRIEMNKELVDLRAVSDAAMDAIRPQAEQAGIDLHVDVSPQPLWVNGDKSRLQQLVVNLLTNAIKYTPSGKRVWFTLGRENGQAVVRVKDEGVGIPKELQEAIFEPFVQTEEPPRGWEGGMGLGLALVRSIALAHDGAVEVASPGRDRGSEFTFRVVLSPDAPAPEVAAELQAPGKQLVLLVDDEEDNRLLLSEALMHLGFEVITAGTGAEAVQAIADHCPAVAIVDIGLPDITGYEVARRARASMSDGKPPYMIALTGFGQQKDRDAATAAGFNEHLVKPVSASMLRKIIAERMT